MENAKMYNNKKDTEFARESFQSWHASVYGQDVEASDIEPVEDSEEWPQLPPPQGNIEDLLDPNKHPGMTYKSLEKNWRSPEDTMEKRLVKLWYWFEDDPITRDVTFLVGPDHTEFKGQKFFLSVKLSYFEKLFNEIDEMKEKETTSPEDIQRKLSFPHLDYKAFDTAIDFLYCKNLTLDSDDIASVIKVLHVAEEFDCQDLWDECIKLERVNFSVENVCKLLTSLTYVSTHAEEVFVKEGIFYLCQQAELVLQSDEFLKLPRIWMKEIIKQDQFYVKREAKVFKAAKRWAIYQAHGDGELHGQPNVDGLKLREILGDSLFEIRFPLMSVQELMDDEVAGILDPEEWLSITCCCPSIFRINERIPATSEVTISDELIRMVRASKEKVNQDGPEEANMDTDNLPGDCTAGQGLDADDALTFSSEIAPINEKGIESEQQPAAKRAKTGESVPETEVTEHADTDDMKI